MKKLIFVSSVSAAVFAVLWIIRLFSLTTDALILSLIGAVLFFFGAVVLKILFPRVRVNRFFSLKPMILHEWELTLSTTVLLISGSFLLNYFTSFLYELLAITAPRAFAGTDYPSVSVALLCVSVLPALFEEIFFRGAVLSSLRSSKMKTAAMILISAFLFMVLHGPGWYFLSDFYAGSVLALLVCFTGSLYSSVVAHFLANTASYFLALYGGRLEDAGIKNLPLHVAVICFLAASCHILHLLKKIIIRRDAEDRSRVNENSRRWEEKKKGEKDHGNQGKEVES